MLSVPCRRGASARVVKPGLVHGPLAPREVDVVLDHHLDQLREGNPRLPAENAARLGRIAAQRIDLGRPEIAAIDLDVLPLVEASRARMPARRIAHGMRLAGRDDVVVGLLLLQHQPHGFDIVASKAPIALRFEVPQIELVLKTLADSSHRPRHLSGNKRLATTRTLMVE